MALHFNGLNPNTALKFTKLSKKKPIQKFKVGDFVECCSGRGHGGDGFEPGLKFTITRIGKSTFGDLAYGGKDGDGVFFKVLKMSSSIKKKIKIKFKH